MEKFEDALKKGFLERTEKGLRNEQESIKIEVFDLRRVFFILSKRKYIILLGVLFSLAVGYLITFVLLEPVYEAAVLLRVNYPVKSIETREIGRGIEGIVDSAFLSPQMTMQTHAGQLKSETVLNKVIEGLGLNAAVLKSKPLSSYIEVVIYDNSNLISVKARNNHNYLAAEIANRVCEEYIEFISEISNKEIERSTVFLKEQHANITKELQNALLQLNRMTLLRNKPQIDYWQSEAAQLRKNMDLLSQRMVETRIAASINYGQSSVVVVSNASIPIIPIKPNKMLNMGLAFFLGLVFFIPLAFLREHLDYRVKSAEDVEAHLDLTVLGTIPRQSGNQEPIILIQRKRSILAEAFRILRTNLIFISPTVPCRSILITSPSPNDGKTTIALNLALILAQAGHRVLLVDCDLRKPSQHISFKLDNSKGLVNILLQDDPANELMAEVSENLWLLPSGPIPPNPSEIISLNKLKLFWEKQKQDFDYILIDAPPVLVVTDPIILASQVDGVILVLNANTTRIELAVEVKKNLDRTGTRIMGVILNRVKINNKRYAYYYD